MVTAYRQQEGTGFEVRRPVPSRFLAMIDSVLLLDHVGPNTFGPDQGVGVPDHLSQAKIRQAIRN